MSFTGSTITGPLQGGTRTRPVIGPSNRVPPNQVTTQPSRTGSGQIQQPTTAATILSARPQTTVPPARPAPPDRLQMPATTTISSLPPEAAPILTGLTPIADPRTTTLTARVTQSKPYQTTVAGTCNCTTCNANTPVATCPEGTWQSGSVPCCGGLCNDQPVCSKVDPSVCPVFSDKALSSNFSPGKAPQVDCQYDLTQFNNIDNVRKWSSLFGQDETYNNQIMPYFCSLSSPNCQDNQVQCSLFTAKDSAGSLCRDWQNKNPQQADKSIYTYCQNNKSAPECRCINRNDNRVYNGFKQYAKDVPDSCWFIPCRNTGSNLVPSNLKDAKCPAGFCAPIVEGFKQTQRLYIPADDAALFLNCPIDRPRPVPSVTPWVVTLWVLLAIFIIVIIILALIRR
jgi:hypothetical protein